MSNDDKSGSAKSELAGVGGYAQAIKSTSLIGGAQGANYVIGMMRTKLVAVLLGPSGVGLVGLYVSATTLLATLSSLGIASSGVREVASAQSSGDRTTIARTVVTLRRLCWFTGFLGWFLSAALAWPISVCTFGNGEKAWAIALLGFTILLGAIAGGQSALLQGTRRIADLALMQILTALFSSVLAVGLYAWLRKDGIIPVLISTAAMQLVISWRFARKMKVDAISQTWRETAMNGKNLVGLGLAFMWSGLLGALAALAIRSLIVRELGLEANGIYQASWGLSGMFAGFILGAMGADYYPRLTSVSDNDAKVNRLVNEQTEIGVLLALPGLVMTLAFAPWALHLFYSAEFVAGEGLLTWFVLGVFGQVVCWPIGFILLAKGVKLWFAASETVANLLKLGLSVAMLKAFGLTGVAMAHPVVYIIYTVFLLFVAKRVCRFKWEPGVVRLLVVSCGFICTALVVKIGLASYQAIAANAILSLAACFVALKGLLLRLGNQHRLAKFIMRVPFIRLLITT